MGRSDSRIVEPLMTNVFESRDVELLLRALDHACAQFRASGRMNGDAEAVARAALAKAIVDAAQQGERDEERLSAYALAHYERAKAELAAREQAGAQEEKK